MTSETRRARSWLALLAAAAVLAGGCPSDGGDGSASRGEPEGSAEQAGRGERAEQDRPELEKVLVDRENGYRVRYPSSWKVRRHRGSTDLVKADLTSPDGRSGINIRVYRNIRGSFRAFTLRYVEDFVGDMQGHHGSPLRVLSRSHGQIGEHDGFMASFMLPRGGEQYYLKQYLWPRPGGDRVHVFQSGCPADQRATNEPVLDAIAESFDFI